MTDISGVPSSGQRRRFSRRARTILILGIVALIVLIVSLRGIAGFYTDYLWFDSLGFSSVWRRVLLTKFALAGIFMGFTFLLLWTNLYIAERIAPQTRPEGPEEALVSRYHETIGSRSGLIRIAVSALFALFLGVGTAGRWQDWILFRNREDFGIKDPQFNIDIGFYVFQLPFIQFLINWFFTAFISCPRHYINRPLSQWRDKSQHTWKSSNSPSKSSHFSASRRPRTNQGS